MKIAIVGATGAVGTTMLRLVTQRFPDLDPNDIILVARPNNEHRKLDVFLKGRPYQVPIRVIEQVIEAKPDYVLMSAGEAVSKEWTPRFAEAGAVVIDNSPAWRMDKTVPLVIPGINDELVTRAGKIFPVGNCAAIMIAHALAPFIKSRLGIAHVTVITMQSVSGAGKKALAVFAQERLMDAGNAQSTMFNENISPVGKTALYHHTSEEVKVAREIKKVFSLPHLDISPACYRVPIRHGHAAHVIIEFATPQKWKNLAQLLENSEKIVYNHGVFHGPTSTIGPVVEEKVFVSNFRNQMDMNPKRFEFFVTANNLTVGAALAAVEILQLHLNAQ